MGSRFTPAPTTGIVISGSGGGGPGIDDWQTDFYISVASQTIFSLSTTPSDAADVKMRVNGITYKNGTDYTVVGTTLTWLNVPFTLDAGDEVEIFYDL